VSRLEKLCGILVSMDDYVPAMAIFVRGRSPLATAVAPVASHAEGSDSPVGVKRAAEEKEKEERKRRRVLRVGITLLREQIEEMEKVIHVMERDLLEGSDSESS